MEAPQPRQRPKHDRDRWTLIKAWGGLSKEAVCAWDTLWQMAVEQGTYSLTVHPAIIGASLGAGDHQRTGKRCLDALESQGLIFVGDKGTVSRGRARGVWTICLEDPWQVHQNRVIRAKAEHQGELFRDDTPTAEDDQKESVAVRLHTEQAVVAPSPPPARSGEVVSRAHNEVKGISQGKYLAQGGDGATTACSVVDGSVSDAPLLVGNALAEALDRLALRVQANWSQQPEEARRIAGRIELSVNDPNLARPLCLRVAWAIIDGLYPQGKLDSILERLKAHYSHRSAKDRGSYFVACMKRSFSECGIEFQERPRPRPVSADDNSNGAPF